VGDYLRAEFGYLLDTIAALPWGTVSVPLLIMSTLAVLIGWAVS
jgi:hypothetical protein